MAYKVISTNTVDFENKLNDLEAANWHIIVQNNDVAILSNTQPSPGDDPTLITSADPRTVIRGSGTYNVTIDTSAIGGGSSGVETVTGTQVDNTDPRNPIIKTTGMVFDKSNSVKGPVGEFFNIALTNLEPQGSEIIAIGELISNDEWDGTLGVILGVTDTNASGVCISVNGLSDWSGRNGVQINNDEKSISFDPTYNVKSLNNLHQDIGFTEGNGISITTNPDTNLIRFDVNQPGNMLVGTIPNTSFDSHKTGDIITVNETDVVPVSGAINIGMILYPRTPNGFSAIITDPTTPGNYNAVIITAYNNYGYAKVNNNWLSGVIAQAYDVPKADVLYPKGNIGVGTLLANYTPDGYLAIILEDAGDGVNWWVQNLIVPAPTSINTNNIGLCSPSVRGNINTLINIRKDSVTALCGNINQVGALLYNAVLDGYSFAVMSYDDSGYTCAVVTVPNSGLSDWTGTNGIEIDNTNKVINMNQTYTVKSLNNLHSDIGFVQGNNMTITTDTTNNLIRLDANLNAVNNTGVILDSSLKGQLNDNFSCSLDTISMISGTISVGALITNRTVDGYIAIITNVRANDANMTIIAIPSPSAPVYSGVIDTTTNHTWGDFIPAQYRSNEYNITLWDSATHWYFKSSYVDSNSFAFYPTSALDKVTNAGLERQEVYIARQSNSGTTGIDVNTDIKYTDNVNNWATIPWSPIATTDMTASIGGTGFIKVDQLTNEVAFSVLSPNTINYVIRGNNN